MLNCTVQDTELNSEEPEVDPVLALMAVRLADEGIPVRAIARGLKIPSPDLYDLLNNALIDGKIVELPKDDWPAGSSRAARAIFAGTILENEEIIKSLCVRLFKATKQQAAVLCTMLRRTELTKDQIHVILQENRPSSSRNPTTIKMVDVVVHHIRKKIKPHGLVIETVWGTGYLITPKHRAMAIKLLETFSTSLMQAVA
jgi:hypothetical protein